MNVNVKLSIDDDTRRAIASYIAGKPVKRLATRADVNRLVNELLLLAIAGRAPKPAPAPREIDLLDPTTHHIAHGGEPGEFCSDDCCRANDLLRSRMNVLQHRLDTMR